jgi:alpha-L-fucosidase
MPKSLRPIQSPVIKQGYLNSPLVETTPISFKGKLYLLECWRSNWDWPGQPSKTAGRNVDMWMAELSAGAENYDKRTYTSRVLEKCTLGTALVWDDRVYVFGTEASSGFCGTELYMTWSSDMTNWSKRVKVLDSPAGVIFNTAVTRDEQGMVFLWETDAYGKPFTMCYGRVKSPSDSRQPGIIEDARYGMHKYTGGPALYYEDGWYYTLYLAEENGGGWATRITRSKDLRTWHDAAENRPFIAYDASRVGGPLRPGVRENNASDAEVCYHKGRSLITFTGSNQGPAGDLQWATFAGTPVELFSKFYPDEPETDQTTNEHRDK